jgi:DNA-binding NtrC family response regulator
VRALNHFNWQGSGSAIKKRMPHFRVLVVDDDRNLRVSLTQFLETNEAVRVSAVSSLSEVQALGQAAMEFDLAILDINLGLESPSGLDVFHWLRSHHFRGRVVFFTGYAKTHPLVAQAMTFPGIVICEKPMDVGQLLDLISEAFKSPSQELTAAHA